VAHELLTRFTCCIVRFFFLLSLQMHSTSARRVALSCRGNQAVI
jgi:preprotein translocase subunit SecG